jgi:hypothetical protein
MHFCKILPKDLVLEEEEDVFRGLRARVLQIRLFAEKRDIVGLRLERNSEYFGGRLPGSREYSPYFTLGISDKEIDIIPSCPVFKTKCRVWKTIPDLIYLGMAAG